MVRIYLAIYDLEWNIETQRIQQQDNTLAISPNQSCVAALEWHDCRINQQLHNQNLLKLPTIGLGSIGITLEMRDSFLMMLTFIANMLTNHLFGPQFFPELLIIFSSLSKKLIYLHCNVM